MTPAEFIDRWKSSGGAEMANSQSFIKELCDLLALPHPDPTQPDETQNAYVFEKAIEFNNNDGTTSQGRVDLYRRGCFILESKQGAESKAAELEVALATKTKKKKFRSGTAKRGTPAWEQAMVKARQQARRYAEAIPDEWPPFLIVADVGHCFDIYADFTQSGKNYVPFPNPSSYRIALKELEVEQTRKLFQDIWLDPQALDPSKRAARVTREVADRLARLAKSMEGEHEPETVAQFLMRCLFTMFAEDVEIGGLQRGDFTKLLEDCRGQLDHFVPMMETLWRDMNTGVEFSGLLRKKLKEFNGGLFANQRALPMNADQLELLIEAAEAEWNDVEPAIFGTLLERALDPVERHKLGAHYTPRAYVERLVMPTIIEPLREEWDTVYATAVSLSESGDDAAARKAVRQFHEQLCETRILDPACGSGNFLYVSLELMKRLEGEVLKALRSFGEKQLPLLTIDPHQFLGIEVNPRAAAITDLVLWIGYLQWHFRTRGREPIQEPIIKKFQNIECRDAVLAWDAIEPVVDAEGNPVTRWDGRTTKTHPVTGEEVPDETARVQELRYINPRKAEWPQADYIVGNPPFVGQQRMRRLLGDAYVNAIRNSYAELPETCDFVMYWWHTSAELLQKRLIRRFGLVTTNSITQSLNRRILESHLRELPVIGISFACPDHPWEAQTSIEGSQDLSQAADVRVAMTVVGSGVQSGILLTHTTDRRNRSLSQESEFKIQKGKIGSALTIGTDVHNCCRLKQNVGVAIKGFELGSQGFLLPKEQAENLLKQNPGYSSVLHPYMNGDDLKEGNCHRFVIDFNGMEIQEAEKYPILFQHVIDNVRPGRAVNREKRTASSWWRFRRSGSKLREAVEDLPRFIATTRTAKFRVFQFCPSSLRAESKIVVIALDDGATLAILSSRPHELFSRRIGGFLGVGNDPTYNHTECFEKFPFPDLDDAIKQRIRELGEQLDAHRKRQQELHPDLTMTGMYNVLEKLRSGEPLTKKEQTIHVQGLVSVLKQIHDDLDAAVCDAYGWPHNLKDEEILQRLVDLNHERAEEEQQGKIRWLRPEFQNPDSQAKKQGTLAIKTETSKPTKKQATKAKVQKQPWPKTLPEKITAVRTKLIEQGQPATVAEIAKHFSRANKETLEELLETLVAVGQARLTDDGRYAG